MIERRNREFTHRAKSICLAMPTNTTLNQNSTSSSSQTSALAKEPQFAAIATQANCESALEQRQRVIVWWLIALLWILFLIAGVILWDKSSLGS